MNDQHRRTFAEHIPLPPGVKLHTRTFGNLALTVFVDAPLSGELGQACLSRPPFTIRWEDEKLGVKVLIREQPDGRLITDVYSRDPSHLNKAAVTVGLIGSFPTEEMNQ